jgi:hypothetical protein
VLRKRQKQALAPDQAQSDRGLTKGQAPPTLKAADRLDLSFTQNPGDQNLLFNGVFGNRIGDGFRILAAI